MRTVEKVRVVQNLLGTREHRDILTELLHRRLEEQRHQDHIVTAKILPMTMKKLPLRPTALARSKVSEMFANCPM